MKYLLEIHHGIGDVVQFTGIIDSLFKYDKDAQISVILNKDWYYDLFLGDDRVSNYYRIDMKGPKKRIIESLLNIRKEKFDYYILSPISNLKQSRLLCHLVGAKESYGEQLEDSPKNGIHHVDSIDAHIVDRNNNVLRTLYPDIKLLPPCLKCSGNLPVEIPPRSVGLCIGTSIPQKTWPIENYIKIAHWLEEHGYKVVLLGGEKEREELNKANCRKSEGWINLLGRTKLNESAKACSLCDLVIGGDTGVMHMAAAEGVTTLSIFSCTNPIYHAPYSEKSYYFNLDLPCQFCYGTEKINRCGEYKCIKDISPDAIIEVVDNILNGHVGTEKKFNMKV